MTDIPSSHRFNGFLNLFYTHKLMFHISWIAFVLFAVIYVFTKPPYIVWDNLTTLLGYIGTIGIHYAFISLAAGVVLSSGNVDISTAGMASLSGVLFVIISNLSGNLWLGAMVSVLIASSFGTLTGYLIIKGSPSLITSWSLGTLFTLFAMVIARFVPFGNESQDVTKVSLINYNQPGSYMFLGNYWILTTTIFLSSLVILTALNRFFLKLKSIGSNRVSSMYYGVSIGFYTLMSFVFSAGLSAMFGILNAMQFGSAPSSLNGKELIAISIAVIGGTVMSGGYINIFSIATAAFLWAIIDDYIRSINYSKLSEFQTFAPSAAFAILILVVVAPIGRILSGQTENIHVDKQTR